ncbi:MAG: AAA family ATPase [Solirubrobacteraceae bacterium]|nr:AAA family ATPase [Solirubrobacteraceae bacterium]
MLGVPAVASAVTASTQYRIEAESGELVKAGKAYKLILRGVDPDAETTTITEPPESGEEPVLMLLKEWGDKGFASDTPIAVLAIDPAEENTPILRALVRLLKKPEWDQLDKTLTVPVEPSFDADALAKAGFEAQGATAVVRQRDFGQASLSVTTSPPLTSETGTFDTIKDFFNEWSTAIGLLFMVLLVFLIWRSLKLVPKTAPQTLKPAARSSVNWDEIAGADDAKEELMEVVQFLKDPKKFRRYGATMPKGVLLHGPPGTGKTLLAKAVAHESGAQFFSQSASSFVEMFAGLGAARIRRLFNEARKHSPAIIFIDELDAVGTKRMGSDSGDREQTLNQLLVEMDGFAGSDDVVVMAASNLLDKLDPALLRPGRFDRQVFVAPPDVAGREEILQVHTRGKPVHDVDMHTIAAQTSGLTGADLANLCNEAAIFCARRDGVAITQADFNQALERVIAGVQSKRVLQPAEKRVVAYHEAGHALCGELLASVDKLHKISIVPRGKALGFTLNLPEEDRYLKTREELLDHMTMLLGGRVAEQIVFGKITTGASDDLKRVAELTHAMVHEYAMGTADSAQRGTYETGQASEVTRRIRDEEQRELAYEAQTMAERLINDHRDLLEALATALLEHEVLERPQIDAIMHGTTPVTDRPRLTGLPLMTAAEELPRADT